MDGEGNVFPNIIDNDGDLEELHRKLDEFISEMEKENKEEIER